MGETNNDVRLKEALYKLLSVTNMELNTKDGTLDIGEVLDGLKERHIISEQQHREILKKLEK